MPEQDSYEASLAAAYRRYLEHVPTEIDAAAVAHEVAGATTRRAPWGLPLPAGRLRALAWLVAVALLLVALLGTSLLLSGAPTDHRVGVATCPPGTDPDRPGPVDQPRPATDGYGTSLAAIDRASGRLVIVATGSSEGNLETWTYDLCSNTWQRMTSAVGPSGHPHWISLVYDEGSGLVVSFDENGAVWAYDVDADEWQPRADIPAEAIGSERGYGLIRYAYDPESDRVDAFVVDEPGNGGVAVWTYDLDSDAWRPAPVTGDIPWIRGVGDHQLVAYDRAVGRFVIVNTQLARTWQYDPATGRWTKGAGYLRSLNTGYFASGGEIAYDERIGRTLVFSDGVLLAYDAAVDAWETLYDWRAGHAAAGVDDLPSGPAARLGHSMAYDPLNERTVVAFGNVREADGWRTGDDMLAYDGMAQADRESQEGAIMYRTATGAFLALLLSAAPAAAADPTAPAAANEQPVVVTGSEIRSCVSGRCTGTHDASDPRVSGDLDLGFDYDCWAKEVCTFSGTIAIVNDAGSWDGHWTGFRDEKGLHRSMGWLSGSGAYEGWSYLVNVVEPEVSPGIDFKGILFPGDLPESVAASLQATE